MVDQRDKKYQELMERKFQLESDLNHLEKQIYDLETRYLEETANSGNILKGWEGCLQLKALKQSQGQQRKVKINPNDRLFSLCSVTSPANLTQYQEEMQEKVSNGNHIQNPFFRPKRTKKKKNYNAIGDPKQQQEEPNDANSSSSSDEYQEGKKKKIKTSRKY